MFPFAQKEFEINLDLPVDDVVSLLNENVDAEVLLRFPFIDTAFFPFEGQVTSSGFRIRRLNMLSKSSSVVMVGEIKTTSPQTTIIKVKIKQTLFTRIILGMWFSALVVLALILTLKYDTDIMIPIYLGLGTCIISLSSFTYESVKSEDALRKLFLKANQ